MHSELANLASESITFLTISYFSVEKNSNSAVGHSNQHPPFDHSSNKLLLVFRWFKFTLKPPYSIAIGKLRLAIWDTSFWTFWLKFGHKGPRDIS